MRGVYLFLGLVKEVGRNLTGLLKFFTSRSICS
jgi:hypothetical protein